MDQGGIDERVNWQVGSEFWPIAAVPIVSKIFALRKPGTKSIMIPVLMVRDVSEAIAFYACVLVFELALATPSDAPFSAILTRYADELHISVAEVPSRIAQASCIVLCQDVDALFAKFVARGLSVPTRQDSPVHQGPMDQTWGTREVYIDDPSGNTIIFQQR